MSDFAISGEGGRDGVASLVEGDSTRVAVHRVIADIARPGAAIGDLHLRRVAWKPGRRLRAFYEVAVDGVDVPVAVRWDQADATRAIELWPTDRTWPHVAAALSPSVLADALRSAGWNGVGEPLVTIVRYRPGQRHVLKVAGTDGTLVYVKIGAPGSGAQSATRARALADACTAIGAGAAAPTWWSDDLGSVAAPAVAGAPLSVSITPELHELDRLRGAGALLAALHRQPTPSGVPLPERSPGHEAALTLRACDHVVTLEPSLEPMLRALVDRARTALSRSEMAPSLLHGDAKIDHLYVTDDTISLIDLDSAAVGDPASDVGRMLASLQWGTEPDAFDVARAALLEGYGAPSDTEDIDAWTALALVKQAARRVSVLDPALPDRMNDAVRSARMLLHGPAS